MATIIAPPLAPQRRPLYVSLSLLMALIAVVGFWPNYFGPLVQGTLIQPLVIHTHAVVFTGWLVLFLTQAALAATRQIRWHLRIGRVGIAYGVLLIAVGLYTTVVRSAALPRGGDAERLLYVATADMVMFAGFFGSAIFYRRKPQLHRRLMVVAATTLLVAAIGRMTFLPPPPGGIPIRFLVWSAPVLLAMVHDFRKTQRVHPVYLIGLAVFVLRVVTVPFAQTGAWSAVADRVFAWVQ